MALTQSARLAGPSWDEEVVPALRKRLETESRTLARRISAISLSSVDEPPTTYNVYSDTRMRQNQVVTSSSPLPPPGGQRPQPPYQQRPSLDRTSPAAPRVNGTTNPSKPTDKSDFQRARTYSSPYASNLPNGHSNGSSRPKLNPTKSADPGRSLSPRPVDVKPTRIPKASRPLTGASSGPNSPYTNGVSHVTPNLPYQQTFEQSPLVPSSSRSTVDLPLRKASGLLNESPPFPTDSTMSSGLEEDPPRPSMESEERPYEHWYRGEVSRNGGVGELRVGRRQEMLDIANYGHLIGNRKAPTNRVPSRAAAIDDTPRPRKRAGSIAGMTNKERERESLYLDEEHVNEIGQVLDEHPLTDLDGEGSDINSLSEGMVAYAYIPGEDDISSSEQWTTTAGAHEMRSTTPTPSMLPRAPSRQQNLPPTRIPGPSSRRSSESRSTMTTSPLIATSRSGDILSPSPNPNSAPSPNQSTSGLPSSSSRQQAYASHTVPTPTQKRGPSPGTKKTRTANATKAAKAKILTGKKEDESKRSSVAYYPSPGSEEDDMADAIPSWTQPIPREGNWDEVVLPVVARKKGLEGYYESATGSPQPKKTAETSVEPAPGTFGFDHSKYRPPRDDFESIPMDEFGRPERPIMDGSSKPNGLIIRPPEDSRNAVRVPAGPPSPAPFADYAPNAVKVVTPGALEARQQSRQQQHQEEEKGAGCCQCVVM